MDSLAPSRKGEHMSFIDKAKEAFEHGKDAAENLATKAKEAVSETVDEVQDAAHTAVDKATAAEGEEGASRM